MRNIFQMSGLAVCAIALSPLSAGQDAGEDELATDEKVTCKYTEVVGSRIPQKICLSNFEWEERRRAQMESKRSAGHNGSRCTGTPC